MKNTSSAFKIVGTAAVLVLLAAVAAVTFYLNRPKALPVTGVVLGANTAPVISLGSGYRLEKSAQGGQIIGPSTQAGAADRVIDLGGGFRMALSANSRRIFSADHPSASYSWKKIDMGYVLLMNDERGSIVVPAALLKAGASASQPQTIEMAGGYRLVSDQYGTRVVSPTAAFNGPETPPARLIDVGNGYYLSMAPVSDQVVEQ